MKIAVIGAGAAGYFAALSAKNSFPECDVQVFEKTGKVLSKVKIFDLTGKLVLTKSIENNDSNPSVNIAALNSGLYMIAVQDLTGNQYQSKLIVE